MQQMLLGLGAADYEIERSLRFNHDDDPYLSFTPSSTGNQKVWTFSAWIKRTALGSDRHYIYSANDGSSSYFALYFKNDNLYSYFDPGNNYGSVSSREFRDTGAWFHLVHQVDAANTTQRIWINGTEMSLSSSRNPGNNNYPMNQASTPIIIGKHSWGTSYYNDMYLAEVHYSDGNKYEPSNFAETNSETGQWVPKSPSITYGTNGFHLKFADNSGTTATTLGKDSSGNGNNFTLNNFSVSAGVGNDSLEDTPTNNFPTFNYLNSIKYSNNYTPIVEEGSLLMRGGDNYSPTTFLLPKSGKWYVEFSKYGNGAIQAISVTRANKAITSYDGALGLADMVQYVSNGELGNRTRGSTSDATNWENDADIVVAIAVDMDNGAVYFARANTWQNSGDPTSGASKTGAMGTDIKTDNDGDHVIAAQGYNGSDSYGMYVNFGQRPFTYTPPTGYKKLCSANLPDPTILLPNKHFDTTLYTGNNSSQSISTLNFQPDLLWFKARSHSSGHALYDSIRGVNLGMQPSITAAEISADATDDLVSFDNDGFTLGPYEDLSSVNGSGRDIVNWAWKGGGSAVTNNDGDISSQVSANTTAGFSIVSYTGNGVNNSNVTIGHGLGVTPDFVIVKNRDSAKEWVVWHQNIGTDSTYVYQNLSLDGTGADSANSDQFRNVDASTIQVRSPDSSNGKVNKSGDAYMAYVFTGIEGYSKFGSYTGNGNSRGAFVYTGFKPAFVITRGLHGTSWYIYDNKRNTYNVVDKELNSNNNQTEATYTTMDFLSNGFKLRTSNDAFNYNNYTYIYIAFAESPFKYSRAL
tara:strand:- start:285 stop:2702 length:2418 start_codon:yes stop_codon:yes gene_type:complete